LKFFADIDGLTIGKTPFYFSHNHSSVS